MKYSVNQRVRELMRALGYKGDKKDIHDFGKKLLGEGERTDKVKNFYRDKNGISTELLVLITTNIVNEKNQPPNGHWLLTGTGPRFIEDEEKEDSYYEWKYRKCLEKKDELEDNLKEKEREIQELKKNVPYTTNQP